MFALGYPKMGCDAKLNEKNKIKEFDDRLAESRAKCRQTMGRLYEKRQAKMPSVPIEQPVSNHFNIYVFPQVNYSDSNLLVFKFHF